MVDYVNEYVLAENAISPGLPFNQNWYPVSIESTYVHTQELPHTYPWYYPESYSGVLPSYVAPDNFNEQFFALTIIVDKNGNYPVAEGVDANVLYYRYSKYYVRADIVDFSLDNGNLVFLYDLGLSISNTSDFLSSIVNFRIGGVPFYQIFFSSGFAIYLVWVIAKWGMPT